MAQKRKSSDLHPECSLYNKKSKLLNVEDHFEPPKAAQSKIDPTYGQRGAFPGLDDTADNDELFYGPANDGLEYLRMVRSEAKTVPNLLVAPASPTAYLKQNSYADYTAGYYADGAYTASPLPSQSSLPAPQEADLDPQDAYYTSLLARFSALRSVLASPPLPPSITPNINAPHLSHLLNAKPRTWRSKLVKSPPTPLLLAQLPQDAVIRGLEVLESLLTKGHLRGQAGKNLGAWAWGLLGRCREVGEMGSEEVGVLRLVGKQAVWLLRKMRGGEVWCEEETGALGEVNEGDGDEDEGMVDKAGTEGPPAVMEEDSMAALEGGLDAGIEEDASNSLARARHRLLSTLHPSSTPLSSPPPTFSTDKTTETAVEAVNMASIEDQAGKPETEEEQMQSVQATLDMLVTIIGSCYGQRDLLEGRLFWDEL